MTRKKNANVYNKKYIPLSEYKKALKMFKDWEINPMEYYGNILFENDEKWNFVNPMKCKDSFKTAYNMLKFIVLKRLIKAGYRLNPYRGKYNNWYYRLVLR